MVFVFTYDSSGLYLVYFKQPIQANNDISAWHNALNFGAGDKCRLEFNLLLELLHCKARPTSITIKLTSDKKLKQIQRRKYRHLQQKLFDAWEQYQTGNKNTSQLLSCCSHLNGPGLGASKKPNFC